jgi:fructuronate reductase
MVKLTDDYAKDAQSFAAAGIEVPSAVDFAAVRQRTHDQPVWAHFGGGNLFRCMQASLQQVLLEKGLADKGIILFETWDDQLIEDIYHKYDNRSLEVVLKADGDYDLKLINSVTESYYINPASKNVEHEQAYARLKEVFSAESLQLVTLTVTEKGYNLTDLNNNYFAVVANDIEVGPAGSQSLIGILTAALSTRFTVGAHPIALLSTDNFSHNGDKLKHSILTIANEWLKNGFVGADFINYLEDTAKVAYPFSMIDRITPSPSTAIAARLQADGFEDVEIIKTEKFTHSAPFVNTEETSYLVVEDTFPALRPQLEAAGVIFTTKAKVDEVERMKVCTCLNPLHTSLAVLGCLLGYKTIYEEVGNPLLLGLIKKVGYQEGLKVVTDPGIISPKVFIDEVIEKRLPNPYIPDTPQRIATDTSQKIPIRFGVTISLYAEQAGLDVQSLEAIPFVLAAWLRYLLGVDDEGKQFERSPDPMLPELDKVLAGVNLGDTGENLEQVKQIINDPRIFGVDLRAVGLSEKIFEYFKFMVAKEGNVVKLLEKIVASGEAGE